MGDSTNFTNNLISEYPDIIAVEFTNIDKAYLKVIFLKFGLIMLILIAGLIGFGFIDFGTFSMSDYVLQISLGYGVFAGLYVVYKLKAFKQRKYAVRECDINYQHGLLTFNVTSVPFNRIQHIEIAESILSRKFNLASIRVFTAGDDSSDMVIHGVPKEKAYQIKQFILGKTKRL